MKKSEPIGNNPFEGDNDFWQEWFKESLMQLIEKGFKTDVLIEWGISDITIVRDKILIKWQKRIFPLEEKDLLLTYGRKPIKSFKERLSEEIKNKKNA